MANKNKNKGKTFERQFAKHLTTVFGLSFNRVPNSGAFIGGQNFFRTKQLSNEQNLLFSGDVIVPIELKNFTFECKFYKKLGWQKLFDNEGESQLNKWIEQAKNDISRKYWFVLFKINNMGGYVVFDKNLMSKYNCGTNYLIYKNDYCIISLDNFFEKNKDLILEMGKE